MVGKKRTFTGRKRQNRDVSQTFAVNSTWFQEPEGSVRRLYFACQSLFTRFIVLCILSTLEVENGLQNVNHQGVKYFLSKPPLIDS